MRHMIAKAPGAHFADTPPLSSTLLLPHFLFVTFFPFFPCFFSLPRSSPSPFAPLPILAPVLFLFSRRPPALDPVSFFPLVALPLIPNSLNHLASIISPARPPLSSLIALLVLLLHLTYHVFPRSASPSSGRPPHRRNPCLLATLPRATPCSPFVLFDSLLH